ncbi:NUDIX domain-containing protein [Pseudoalteromonas denitrificans]|uniref:ADP-ribose pyrophosphatase n=1 Tax=Pseudoalteromonas denitrificans DSM 6059 TaxID=1123010 RepID=A0A1I1E430_9GAMM|nr:NUDIX domain-containing protein [Pseudoalteromonas denitrificans]SFB81999.1 ADP-ribose pyrophosphatase [Pseudoalteromonas denitrificans DSM 6059]
MNNISIFKSDDIEVVEKEAVYKGFFKIERYGFRHKLFSGGYSDIIYREILERGHAVAVLPYDAANDTVLLIEQVRIGALDPTLDKSPWLLECIAGMADGSDDYQKVAIKEAQEEAGLELDNLTFMLSYLSSPGGTTERLYLYLAQTDLSQSGGLFGLDHEGEDIKVHVIPRLEAMTYLEQGCIDNAASVICLQWLALNLDKFKL